MDDWPAELVRFWPERSKGIHSAFFSTHRTTRAVRASGARSRQFPAWKTILRRAKKLAFGARPQLGQSSPEMRNSLKINVVCRDLVPKAPGTAIANGFVDCPDSIWESVGYAKMATGITWP